jgi:SAM-dependent methyltransferase
MDGPYGNWQKYQNQNPIQRALIKRFLDTVTALIEPLPVRSILDAGCGEGFVLDMLLRSCSDLQVAVGIDIDTDALRRGTRLSPQIPFMRADILHLPHPTDLFDVVVCTEVLEHLETPDVALKELCRVSNRFCLFSVPHEPFFRLSNLLRGKSVSRLGNDIDHLQNWSQTAFSRFLSEQLELLAIRRSFPWLIALGQKH